jgi:acetyl-CoA carboxylase carboxyl transferase subunit alpha
MLQHAYYSVISPEGCAGILWRVANAETKSRAADALCMRADDLSRLDVIDHVVAEPPGGAHRVPREMAGTLKATLKRHLRELVSLPTESLLAQRYAKFRKMGIFG